MPIQPDVDLEMKEIGCTPYAFDKQLVLDIGVHLQQQPSDIMMSNTSKPSQSTDANPLRSCFICNRKTTLDMVRGHVAFRIISSNLKDVCGFCGREGNICETYRTASSHCGSKKYNAKIVSSCDYKYDYKRVPDDTTKTHKCTNKIVFCKAMNCNRSIWRYNDAHHYQSNHPALDIPPDFTVSENEKKIVLKAYRQ